MAAVMMHTSWSEVIEKQKPRHRLVTTRAQVNERTSQNKKVSWTPVLGNMATMEHAMVAQKGDGKKVARCNGESSFNKHPAKATATQKSGEQKEGDEEDSVCTYSV